MDGWISLPILRSALGCFPGRAPVPKFPPGCPTSHSRGMPLGVQHWNRHSATSDSSSSPGKRGSGTDLAHLAPQPGKCCSDSGWVCPLITFPPLFRVLQVTAAALGFDAGCSHGNGAGSGFVLTHPGTLLALTNCIFNRSLYWVFEVYVL